MHTGEKRRGVVAFAVAVCVAWLVVGVTPAAFAVTPSTTVDGITYTANTPDAGVTVTGYVPGPTVIDIPSTVDISSVTYDVTAISASVFAGTAITSVTIPSTVLTIGASAFSSDNNLASLDLGTGVTSIGDHAFVNAGHLTSVTLPDSVTTVGAWAFDSEGLTSLTLSNNLTTIATQAFSNENHLTSVAIPASVTTIGYAAFAADNFTSLTIGSGVTAIGQYAFAYNNNLTTVTIPASVTSIGSQVFQNNSSGSLTATFEGAAPATFGSNVFATNNPLIVYSWRFGSPQTPGGYTSPTWNGYATEAIATVDFTANGHGADPSSATVPVGQAVTAPAEPTAAGYAFVGWFTAATGGAKWDFATDEVTSDTTLYAHWSAGTTGDPTLATTGVDPAAGITAALVALLIGTALAAGARRRHTRLSRRG